MVVIDSKHILLDGDDIVVLVYAKDIMQRIERESQSLVDDLMDKCEASPLGIINVIDYLLSLDDGED